MSEIKQFDLVRSRGGSGVSFMIVLMKLDVPYFDDNMASYASMIPLDFTNPEEWMGTFEGYLVYDLLADDYRIVNKLNVEKWENDHENWYIPFDLATGDLRRILGFLKLAEKWYGKKVLVDEIKILV